MNPSADQPAGDQQLAKVVYHSPSLSLQEWRGQLESHGFALREVSSLEAIQPGLDALNVILLDDRLAGENGLQKLDRFAAETSPASVIRVIPSGLAGMPAGELPLHVSGVLQQPLQETALMLVLRGAFWHAALQRSARVESRHRSLLARNLDKLTQIGIALSAEKNHHRLLDTILTHSRELTNADAGSLYLVEETSDGKKNLRFVHTQNDSKRIPFKQFIMPAAKTSISGYVAVTGETLNLPDVYDLPAGVEYSINKSFDQSVGYRSKSMLVVPMRDHHNEITGVLQLINAKPSAEILIPTPEEAERHVVPFEPAIEHMISSLASQAAVSLENSMLLESLERTFEGLVKASVHAIEQRDPITSGHSERVTELTCALARAVHESREGRYAETLFTEEQMKELRYSGFLHDFGKIGVREHVLQKANKLYPLEMEVVKNRFAVIKRTIQAEYQEWMVEFALAGKREEVEKLRQEMNAKVAEADHYLELIIRSDVPSMMPDGDFDGLMKLGEVTYKDFDGTAKPYLTAGELKSLAIRRGNLTEEERKEIESHVTHSYNFLVQIPWTKALRGVPEIAHGHHEKLNGKGYPRGLKEEEIILQAKMMCVCDIFDALTATDRPYKKAAPLEKAIQILKFEVKDHHLDPDLLDIFVKKKVYRAVAQFKEAEYTEPAS